MTGKGAGVDRALIWKTVAASALVALALALGWLGQQPQEGAPYDGPQNPPAATAPARQGAASFDYADVPDYAELAAAAAADGREAPAWAEINGGEPFFSEGDFARGDFVELSELDERYEAGGNLGRAGPAFAMVGPGTAAGEKRGPLRLERQPSGWVQGDYRDEAPGVYLYNRCHLLAWSLAGNAVALGDVRNLMTGTRFFNVSGMGRCEEKVRTYVEETGGRVLYRVTPVFEGDDLLARGVLVEAASVGDRDGAGGLRLCRWCYNVQPGVEIDYATGENRLAG